MTRAGLAMVCLAAAVALLGCGGGGLAGSQACAPGQTQRCECAPDQPAGQQICDGTRKYGACMCPSAPVDAAVTDAPAAVADASFDAVCRRRVCGTDVLCGVEDDGCGGKLDCGKCWDRARGLIMQVRSLVADPRRQLLYASVPGDAPANPNTIVTIDPVAMKVTRAVDIGSNPNVMALADDGNTLWVGIDGALSIRRVDLGVNPPAVGPLMPLPLDVFQRGSVASAILPLPGAPRSVVVISGDGSSGTPAAALLDDGVVRPNRLSFVAANLTLGPAGTLLGMGSSFDVVTISPTGLALKELFGLFEGGPLTYTPGRLYLSSGNVYDVSDLTRPTRVGRFTSTGTIFLQPSATEVVMVSGSVYPSSGAVTARLLDTGNFVEIRSRPISNLAATSYGSFVRLGPDMFALVASWTDYSQSPIRQATSVVVFETSVTHPADGGT